jgi:signal transduction histidine kinase
MTRVHGLRELGRRVVVLPDWPLLSGLLLTFAALVESVLRSSTNLDLALNVAAAAPMAVRGRYLPVTVVGVSSFTVALLTRGQLTVAALVAELSMVYLAAARYPRVVNLVTLAPLAVNVWYPYHFGPRGRAGALVLLTVAVMAAALGDARRQRGRVIAEREDTRREMAEVRRDQATLAERSRIARELHDVVAHHVSMIAVQAETSRLGLPGLPPAGQETLAAIGDTARQALTEMRRLVGVLRSESDQEPEREPQPGLDRLDELVDAARTAGTPVALHREGLPRPLAPWVGLTAYRIIQEALTNVRQHAPRARAEVLVRYHNDILQVRVRDDGPAGAKTSGGGENGHGLLGMQERAAMVGGRFWAGPLVGGGFLVEAELPVGHG